uniref:Uncharacterized protein n=1 Tax=Peronospora matthiolae TaxID=2874970 RepID=A0AAV1TYD4_9STRA
MRLTTLYVLFICASLTAQKALTDPIASELGTSQGPAARGVPEARGSFSFSAFFEWLANIFKSSRLKELENKLVPVESHLDALLYVDIRAKIEEMRSRLDVSFLPLTGEYSSVKLVELDHHACELFKSHEFRAVYQKLSSLKDVDADAAMYDFLVLEFDKVKTAQLLWLGAVSGRGNPQNWARLVENAQYRKWMESERIFRPREVSTFLGVKTKDEHGRVIKSNAVLVTLSLRYWDFARKDYEVSMKASLK